jgi:hypothetical protein
MKSFFKNNSEEVISDFIGLVSDYITKKISFQELDISQFNISKANIKEIFSEINKNCKVTCNDKNILTNLKN